jgi:hypothetical protein
MLQSRRQLCFSYLVYQSHTNHIRPRKTHFNYLKPLQISQDTQDTITHFAMPASNIYEVLDSVPASEANGTSVSPPALSSPELSSSELDWTDESTEEDVYSIPFNLVQLGTKLNGKPIFTRHLLQEVKDNKTAISTEMQKPLHIQKPIIAVHQSRLGKFKIWNSDADDADDNNGACASIRLMTRAELHPDFQRDYWRFSKTIRLLRVSNRLQAKNTWIPAPYTLDIGDLASSNDHRDVTIMRSYWKALQNTKSLWLKSSSCAKLRPIINNLALTHKPITKVVCFGLGALDLSKTWWCSALQHITAFTMAKQLEQIYRKQFSHKKPVKIILQDPCYTQKDRELLRKLYGGTVSFASDPDGLLAIDSSSIVVTAFLPVHYPLMQIIVDMFHGTNGEGPAAIVCDSMALDPTREFYALRDRSSPEVARFLTEQYVVSDFKDHVMEQELAEDCFGAGNNGHDYWLSGMQLYSRK